MEKILNTPLNEDEISAAKDRIKEFKPIQNIPVRNILPGVGYFMRKWKYKTRNTQI